MDLGNQIKISNTKLARDLGKNRAKLAGIGQEKDKFTTEFRKVLDNSKQVRISASSRSNRQEVDRSSKEINTRKETDDYKDKKVEDKKLDKQGNKDSEKVDKDKKDQASQLGEVDTSKEEAINNSTNVLPPKIDYGKEIDEEFLELINSGNKDIMIDEDTKQIIILDETIKLDPDLDMEIHKKGQEVMDLSNEELSYLQGRSLRKEMLDSIKNSDLEYDLPLKNQGVQPVENLELADVKEELGQIDLDKLEQASISEDLNLNLNLEDLEGEEETILDSKENFDLNLAGIKRNSIFMNTFQSEEIDSISSKNLEKIQETMIDNIETMVDGDKASMKVQLYPKNLGSVNIELTMENGKVLGKIIVEDTATKQMFLNNLDKLNENLLRQDIQVSKLDISLNDGNNWSDASSNFNQSSENFNRENRENQNNRQANLRLVKHNEGDIEQISSQNIKNSNEASELNILL